MEATTELNYTENQDSTKDPTRMQIRGSSLLLLGKFFAVGLNLASQVLIVRYLSKSDYGAWTYALAVILFFNGFATLGLKRAITRFVPIYHEKDKYEELFGTILLVLGTILCTGLVFTVAVYIAPESISGLICGEEQPVQLLLILIFMVPVEALDGMLIGLFASFASPRTIFTRKFIIGPGLKLVVVLILILFGSEVVFLAYGYLIANAIAVMIYSWVLIKLMKKRDLFRRFAWNKINIPVKEILSFTIPLLTSDLVMILMHSSATFILGYSHGTTEVALYRVILPAARFNKMVMISFALLYTPSATRLFAKDDYVGINHLYWQTAIWLSVLTFPIFVITFCMAKPLTVALYGVRYEECWFFLQLISLGYYFNVVLGFNGLTLKVLGKVGYVVIINVLAVVFNLILSLLLIPRYGALGASIATAGSLIVHNILKQAGLRLTAGISIFEWQYLSFYLLIVFNAVGIMLFQHYITNNIFVLLPLAALVSLIAIMLSQDKLKVIETFPELLKLPFMRLIFHASSSRA